MGFSQAMLLVLLTSLGADAVRRAAPAASPKKVSYDLTITYGAWAPDCVQRQIYLINGQYPGPTLTATEGDTLVVTVRNGMEAEGVAIHWHGIRQEGSNLMDGTGFVTQCPITPGDYFVYTFTADKAGTYMYHGHLENQAGAGLYGSLVVKEKKPADFPYPYQGELSLILNDWYHRSMYEQTVGLDSKPFQWVGNPQALLINGRGRYNCSLIPAGFSAVVGDVKACNASSPQCARAALNVVQGKWYRLRIASIASLVNLNLVLENHTFSVVAADAYAVKPFAVGPDGLDLYPGQTVDVVFKADQPAGRYWIRAAMFGRANPTPFALGVLRYYGASSADPLSDPPPMREFNDVSTPLGQALRYKADGWGVPKVPKTANREVLLVNAQQLIDGYIKWAISGYSLKLPSIPYSIGIANKVKGTYGPTPPTSPSPWNYSAPAPQPAKFSTGYYQFLYGSVVDLVLQNTNNLAPGASDYHPWHMHGHNFWVLAYGNGTYNHALHAPTYNLNDPPYRNTVNLFPYGWVVVRFLADNPGAWMFHCHIGFHLHMGMAIVFVDGKVQKLPSKFPTCGIH